MRNSYLSGGMSVLKVFGGLLGMLLMLFMVNTGANAGVNADTQSRLEIPALETPRYGAAATVVEGSLYVIGGSGSSGLLGGIERIDLNEGLTVPMNAAIHPRRYLTAEAVNHLIYITGGYDSKRNLVPLLEIYDPKTDQISTGAPLPTPRYFASSDVIDGKIYVVGGSLLQPASSAVATVEVYDVGTDSWESGPSLSVARQAEVVALNGLLYAIGGYDGSKATRIVEVLDPKEGAWRRLSDLPFPMSAHRAVALGGRIYTFGDYYEMDRVWVYDPDEDSWDVLLTDYLPARHAAAASTRNDILIVGGNISTSGTHLDYVQRFTYSNLLTDSRPAGFGPWTPRARDIRGDAAPFEKSDTVAIVIPHTQTFDMSSSISRVFAAETNRTNSRPIAGIQMFEEYIIVRRGQTGIYRYSVYSASANPIKHDLRLEDLPTIDKKLSAYKEVWIE